MMGQVFSQLTQPNSMMTDPDSGQSFVGSPQKLLAATKPALQSQFSPSFNGDGLTPNPGTLPKIGTPSYQQAASSGATPGGENATSPGLTKAGKLMTLLTGGLQGALAGRAANEQATVASGGRRSGGVGMGFEAGYTLPWQREQQLQQLEQQKAQTGVLQSEGQTFNLPGVGPVPGWLAKTMGPAYLRQQGTLGSAQIGAQAGIEKEQIGKRYMAVPNVGLYDTQSKQLIPGTQQGVTVTPEIQKEYQLPDDFIGKPMTLANLSTLERAQSYQNVVASGANGPSLVNRNQASPDFGKTTPLGLGNPSMGRPLQVGDVNNPGQTTFATAGNAIANKLPGTQSASVQVPRQAQKAAVPTKIGDQRVAFTTMIQHAQLLRDAASALQNGDVQTLNGLKNAFKNEFGYSGPITAQAIADAYGGEVTNVIAKGHITDAEMGKTSKTINPSKQNMATINSVLGAYQALAQSKMNMLGQQTQAAVNASQPKNKQQQQNEQPVYRGGNLIGYTTDGKTISRTP